MSLLRQSPQAGKGDSPAPLAIPASARAYPGIERRGVCHPRAASHAPPRSQAAGLGVQGVAAARQRDASQACTLEQRRHALPEQHAPRGAGGGAERDRAGPGTRHAQVPPQGRRPLPPQTPLAGGDDCVEGHHVWPRAALGHLAQEAKRLRPALARRAGTDRGVERDSVRSEAPVSRIPKQPQCMVPLQALLACARQRVEGDQISLGKPRTHLAEESKRTPPLPALLASAECGSTCNHVWPQTTVNHVQKDAQHPHPMQLFPIAGPEVGGVVNDAQTQAAAPRLVQLRQGQGPLPHTSGRGDRHTARNRGRADAAEPHCRVDPQHLHPLAGLGAGNGAGVP
eukprot:CAMPEP_0175635146 /NCGR_PEP_ID=MMETSP0097-20121207/1540_1 /TAXON_ID=311494 /ORGANISM="Alexandrium monilatum, Strain CCMP3105" /LENGTH=340 /DNA_ID=CAMNT_0016940773 /DNA_START=231 /DNA_END=1248 /DNA_ORIENTATION=-